MIHNAKSLKNNQKCNPKYGFSWYIRQLLLFYFLNLCIHPSAAEITPDQEAGVSLEIKQIIAAKQHPELSHADFSNRTDDLESLYKLTGYQLLWLGKPNTEKNINELLSLFETATANGLNPVNYDLARLRQKLESALKLDANEHKPLALYDTALSLSLLRFLHDLHYGQINPQGINFNLKLREKKSADLPALIQQSVAIGSLSQLPSLVEPKLNQYQKLKLELAKYRRLAEESQAINLVNTTPIRPGQLLYQIDDLRKYLVYLGDLEEEKSSRPNAKNSNLYKGNIVEAVKKLQRRHGLSSDGVLGKGTVEAINTPISQRVAQIELAMERLRWLPETSPGRSIIVNIPSFQLWAFNETGEDFQNSMNMKVVVGKALETQTPVLMAEMSFIDFFPYWNVPDSIVTDEILPKWIKNPNYLKKEDMELVHKFGNKVKSVPFNENSIDQVKQGLLKIRQLPGKKNPLGYVKFIFPNKEEVYLHGTSANSLFKKSRRDFSHGCVRVEKPELLAQFALNNQGKWTKEAIREAMKATKTQRVILKKPIPVLFFYTTSFIDQNDSLVFYPDIYGFDAVLQEALQKIEDVPDNSLFVSTQTPLQAVVDQ